MSRRAPVETQQRLSAALHLAAVVESSDDAIVTKTLDGIVTSWNRAAEKMFGYTAEEAIGRHITLIIPEERRAEEEQVLERIRHGDKIDHFETIRVAKDGRLVPISLTVSPIKDADGRVVGASKIARDISERLALMASEQAAHAEAEAANRAKDRFLAVLSHELRTPLNAIIGWTRVLRNPDAGEPERAHAAQVIERNAARQAQLINDLLDVSRITAGKLELDRSPVELVPLIQDVIDALRGDLEAKKLQLMTNLDPSTGEVFADPLRLQQVVSNLLTNAVKFTPEGRRIDVQLARCGHMARLIVTDTGDGIDETVLPHIFEPFLQGDSSAARIRQGLGLGLAIVRQLVTLHGGTVSAESPGKGKGATFTVELPVIAVRASLGPGRAEAATRGSLAAAKTRLDGLRVLVVDDQPETCDLVTLVLRQRGADTRIAASVAEALEILADTRIDVLVSDLAMPGGDGYDLMPRCARVHGDGTTEYGPWR